MLDSGIGKAVPEVAGPFTSLVYDGIPLPDCGVLYPPPKGLKDFLAFSTPENATCEFPTESVVVYWSLPLPESMLSA